MEGTIRRAGGRRRLPRGVVLPRPLRRPARTLERLNWRLPRHLGLMAVGVLFAVTAGAGIVMGGHGPAVIGTLSAWSGLAVDEVRISGQSRTGELDVLSALDLGPYPSLITLDLDAARLRVEDLPWVKQAALRKRYPGLLEVEIAEREPFAVWRDGEKLWLINERGRPISDEVDARYAGLPMVVGAGAAARAQELTDLLAAVPSVGRRARAGVLVGERRWTIVLDDGVELMLPEDHPLDALRAVAALDARSGLLSRAITAVDLRLADRLVVRLEPAAASARAALLKARAHLAMAKGA
jgi:cell division protein FtsQ